MDREEMKELLSPRMRAALDKLQQRAQAAAGTPSGEVETFTIMPMEDAAGILNATLNGYVDEDDLESALAFVATIQMGMIMALVANPSVSGSELGMRFAVAQAFLAGVLYERELADSRGPHG